MNMDQTLSEKHLIYQSNVLPNLLKKLADQLHVSCNALLALEIGYALRIPLKDGGEFQNCWVFPERDETGRIIGLSLRKWNGEKRMVPGSKRGLSYVPNIHQTVLDSSYQTGPQNWERVTASTPCPICDKPDWCLVSAENPNDPKAVLCSRIQTGSVKDIGTAGYLHIRKPSGYLARSGAVLLPSDSPILLVEGATDVAAAFDLGFVAIGRPNDKGCLDILSRLVAGRSVIVLGENDAGAGREGMEKTFEIIHSSVSQGGKLLPPVGIKDLRQWLQQGLTHDDLLDIIKTSVDRTQQNSILPSDAPLDLAKLWLKEHYYQEDMYTLRYFHGSWYRYESPCYIEIEKTDIRKQLYCFFAGKKFKKLRVNGFDVIEYQPTKYRIDQIIDAMLAFCPIASTEFPCWIDREHDPIDPRRILVFTNGMLFVDEYMAGTIRLHPITPHFFTFTSYPYDFDPDASQTLWMKFLDDLFSTDIQKVKLLQEWFGYNLLPDNSYEKFMVFLGPTRAGKSTMLDVLTYTLGESQVLATSFRDCIRRFGLYPFLGKLAAIIGDVTVDGRYDISEALNLLKRITGNDAVMIERKGKDVSQTYIKLYSRFTMAANVMPRFPDYAHTIESRLLIVQFLKSFAGQEDTTLKTRLKVEAPGILLWALDGLRRLQQNNSFTLPSGHDQLIRRIRDDMTPIAEFISECCTLDRASQQSVRQNQLYECWQQWAIRNGEKPHSARWLSKCLLTLYPHLIRSRRVIGGMRCRIFEGLALTEQAKTMFLGETI